MTYRDVINIKSFLSISLVTLTKGISREIWRTLRITWEKNYNKIIAFSYVLQLFLNFTIQ